MATNPPRSSGIGDFLRTQIGPLPMWVWIGVGGIVLGIFVVPRLINRSSAKSPNAADQTSPDAGTAAINTLSQAGIDPFTGVPLSIEGAINPATGNANYYNPPTTGGSPVTNPPPTPPGSPPPPPPPPPQGQGNPNIIPQSGINYTTPFDMRVIDVAETEYGFQPGDPRLNNAVYNILTHNLKTYPGDKWNSLIPAGRQIFIPPDNPATGFGVTPQQ